MKKQYKFNRLYNREYFLGERKGNEYFEGWYFKNVTCDNKQMINIIVGISKARNNRHAFIQVIENITNRSYYFTYDIKEFGFIDKEFKIKIGDNYFSKNKIILKLKNDEVRVEGILKYTNLIDIKRNMYSPNIMGPFSYIPVMQCNHEVISLGHSINGEIRINHKKIKFKEGLGYIEKDYGTSFPEKYIWLQANKKKTEYRKLSDDNLISIFMAIATIPLGKLEFIGNICSLYINREEYRFALYNGCKVHIINKNNNKYNIILKQGELRLVIILDCNTCFKLKSPKKGSMCECIDEYLDGECRIILYKNKKIIYKTSFKNLTCELEN